MLPVARALPHLLALLALAACGVSRPEGAYLPRQLRADAGGARADSDEEIYSDAQRVPSFDSDPGDDDDDDDDSGGPDGESPIVERDAGPSVRSDSGEPPAEAEPESPLVGDYWMRADVATETSLTALTTRITTLTDTQVYSLLRVDYQSGKLKFADFQCALRIVQRCTAGCSSVSTTLLDPVKSGRAYLPAFRDLQVDESGSWSAGRMPYALGWKGDFSKGATLALPTSDSDPLVYDPDGGGGKGVDLTVMLKPNILPAQTCNLRVVQKIDVTYAGKLEQGALRSGTMADVGSGQNVLASSCRDTSSPEAMDEGSAPVRIIAAKRPIDLAAAPWPCPTLSEFQAAFP